MEQAKIFAAAQPEFDTFPRLIDALGLQIEKDMTVAIKVDFLQRCPAIVQPLFMALAQRGASPFLTDCSVPFGDALQSLNAAAMNGYVSGAPCVLADGVKGTDYDLIPVRGGKRLRSAKLGRAVMDADLILTDPVERCNGSTHALRTVFRKSLDAASCLERHICQKQRRCLGALAASSMPSDLYCVFHRISLCIMKYFHLLDEFV